MFKLFYKKKSNPNYSSTEFKLDFNIFKVFDIFNCFKQD